MKNQLILNSYKTKKKTIFMSKKNPIREDQQVHLKIPKTMNLIISDLLVIQACFVLVFNWNSNFSKQYRLKSNENILSIVLEKLKETKKTVKTYYLHQKKYDKNSWLNKSIKSWTQSFFANWKQRRNQK